MSLINSDPLSVQSSLNPLLLLDKLVDHPNGVELLRQYQEFYQQVQADQHPVIETVKGRIESRIILIDALSKAKEFVIISSPWLSQRSLDHDILLRMTALLDRGCYLYIGWGYSYDIKGINPYGKIINISRSGECFINMAADTAGHYSAFPKLQELRKRYPEQLELKLTGTHEKYIVCDRQFAMVGSHNVLSSHESSLSAPREMGVKTTDQSVIADLIEDFFNAPDLKYDPNLVSEATAS